LTFVGGPPLRISWLVHLNPRATSADHNAPTYRPTEFERNQTIRCRVIDE